MRKVLVFQHVAHKILGTLNPTLKEHGLRIRYVNFERNPDEAPSLEKYHGLIVLGGHMGVYEAEIYKHIKIEMQLIEEALKKNIPILGICLGAQMLAHVLGADVRQSAKKEIGWYDLNLTDQGLNDPVLSHFQKTEKVFQLHGDTFEIPKSAIHLASSELFPGQAFRYGEKVYGLQCHLEVDQAMIHRWLDNKRNQHEIANSNGKFSVAQIRLETEQYISHSMDLSRQTFSRFIELFTLRERPILLGSDEGGKSSKHR
ncbi:MAG: gamma-glutamyl-gamma-aminobutyrate hydrolase family protein [Bacteriovorax sp.]|nr:gamma-glutamyl-gamma-aminobutyrate hydrolase family protein [Bacteriovorax sp.]